MRKEINIVKEKTPTVGVTQTNSLDVKIQKGDSNMEYIYGVHCGDENCYACGTQRYNCDELNKLDDMEDNNV